MCHCTVWWNWWRTPRFIPTLEATTDVEEYLMSIFADLSLQVCGGIGCERPTLIQLFKAVHGAGDGRDTPDSSQPTTDLGCAVHIDSKRVEAGLEAPQVLMT